MEGALVSIFPKVSLKKLKEDLSLGGEGVSSTEMRVYATHKIVTMSFPEADNLQLEVRDVRGTYRTGPSSLFAKGSRGNALIQLSTPDDCDSLWSVIEKVFPIAKEDNAFDRRTVAASAQGYFKVYGSLGQQQVMLQDYPRTSTYRKAFLQNKPDIAGKVVLDVGAGSGILSLFCAQTGAAKVYAVEASNMAKYCKKLALNNNMDHIITVVEGKLEEIVLPEKVDIIVSEPMGYLLFNERMVETYLHAKKFLKPGGKMFPTEGNVYIAPFMDETLYSERTGIANFWSKTSFHDVDLSCLYENASEECLTQPVKGDFDEHLLMAKPTTHRFDFLTTEESDLKHIVMPLHFEMASAGNIHGLAIWFDVHFIGSVCTVVLSTSPADPLTHWYQVRCLLKQPMPVEVGTVVTGTVDFKVHERQSYYIDLQLTNTQTAQTSANVLDMKNIYRRYKAAPPTSATDSSADKYVEAGGVNFG